ncbi:MAG: CoA pyrophosphatase [Thermoplasmata archaeon]|nr:CoA pyrophosphatase [Thermoplasmata archaeon]
MTLDRYRQRVPRPEGARPAPLPPWSGAASFPNPSVAEVAALFEPLDESSAVPEGTSAVLVPLIERPGGLSVIFTRRATTLSRDAGNVAFPGGRRDGDESMLETALRESEEEIGLDRSAVTVLGELATAFRATDRARVAPFVGAVAGDPQLRASPAEVEEIFEVPIVGLFGDGVGWEEHWTRNGLELQVAFFADDELFGHDLLWGLTARITWQLLLRIWSAATGEPLG